MNRSFRFFARDARGAAALEFALAAPALILMMWGLFQIGLIFLANAGTQSALGEAARYATIYPTPSDSALQTTITSHKFGLKNGTWSTPTIATDAANGTKTIHCDLKQLLLNAAAELDEGRAGAATAPLS